MSEVDVSLIQDEDVLRRMWQQTEDFSRKKEIRAHMYRLREERLRTLYSPAQDKQGKGVESAQTHVQSLLDQSFQGLKSKEVRDAGSPPKDYCRGPDLKELSNAGWNVESETRTSEDGSTRVRSTTADIEGKYEVPGGAGQFAAVDHQRTAVTDRATADTNLHRTEASADTAAREQVYHQTDDGAHFSATTTSSSTSKVHQVSSTKQQVPYTNEDYDSRDTNRREEVRQISSNTKEYEKNLRHNDYESNDLISRKVEYPDENTKIVVETRCLPDGTRVTSTRREFRAPGHTSRSEQHSQTKSESKSYSTSSNQRSDFKSTKIESDSRNNDIVKSQKHIDDFDFKKNQINYLNQKDENTTRTNNETTRLVTKQSSSNVEYQDVNQACDKSVSEKYVDNYDVHKKSHSEDVLSEKKVTSTQKHNHQQYETNENSTQYHEIITKDDVKLSQDKNIKDNYSTTERLDRQEHDRREVNVDTDKITDIKHKHFINDNKDYVNNIKKNQKTEEIFEKTDNQYQTTYQTEFTQKKVSNDWSPTHQAWASTLRTDSPSSSRPTTRASSPGSRTYQSSTSSLRSSVSPDKTYRKTPSRGGSPTKADRSLPSQTSTDHYSSTRSTHSETRYTHISPDRKPPVSPNRGHFSPDRKQPTNQTRASTSPEKRPQTYRPSVSPERKPGYVQPSDHSRNSSPSKNTDSVRPPFGPGNSSPKKLSPSRTSVSPDRKPGYMKPTANSSMSERISESHVKRVPSESPERKPYSKVTNNKEDHYKFIDEETKMYMRTDKDEINYSRKAYSSPDRKVPDKSSSPMRTSAKDDNDSPRPESPIRPTLRKSTRSPSPPKGPVTFEQDQISSEKLVTNVKTKQERYTDVVDKTHKNPEKTESLRKDNRDLSPSKYDTYDKKQRNEKIIKESDQRYDSLTRREKISREPSVSPTPTDKPIRDINSPTRHTRQPSPSKYDTYDKKRRTDEELTVTTTTATKTCDSLNRRKTSEEKFSDIPRSSYQNSKRHSVSPVKTTTKDVKNKNIINFIETEKTRDEANNKTATKTRQLVTPSTSPTRKPKKEEKEPSTGQSSPTTSVSGFVYFSSPKVDQTVTTDLDDVEYYSENVDIRETVSAQTERPHTLHIEKSPPASKIPCRSPSPEKRSSPAKASLPRKSSLKKPTPITDISPQSPVEKPPSSFRVSPADEEYDFLEHKIVKKDKPDKPIDSPIKPKPPLERRETYEERCRKILGMVEDDKNTIVTKSTKSNISSSVSPCESPEPIETSNYKKITTETDVTDFIAHEQKDTLKKTVISDDINITTKRNKTSRETSPTKLQDIITTKGHDIVTIDTESLTKERDTRTSRKTTPQRTPQKHTSTVIRPSNSPDKRASFPKPTTTSETILEPTISCEHLKETKPHKILRQSPDKETGYKEPTRNSVSPDRKSKLPYSVSPVTSKPSSSPEKEPGYMRPTITSTNHETTGTTEDILDEFTSTTIRESLDRETGYTRDSREKECSPKRQSPERKPDQYEPKLTSKVSNRQSPDHKPGHMKSTSATNYKHEDINVINHDKEFIVNKRSRSSSPTKPVNVMENVTKFIQTEREQQILDKVQKSLRKLSPTRDQRSPSREKSPGLSTISLQNIDITTETLIADESTHKQNTTATAVSRLVKPKEHKPTSKPLSRNASPTKKYSPKSSQSPSPKPDRSPELPQKSRSVSPKKPISSSDKPQLTQVPKPTGNKPREQVPSQLKKTPSGNSIPVKIDKVVVDVKKSSNVSKQNSSSKIATSTSKITTSKFTSPTRPEPENKRAPTPKGNKENVSPKKEDNKITRTTSDASLKNKKTSPQRTKSKPEIQINDVITSTNKTTTVKATQKTSTKLAPKPKSATALNISIDEDDDIIIDVEQAKSSRENSPDRICPTPVNFSDDVGTPRYPDEVSEPDDDFRKRTHHTIHETETIVDDIVEIDEDEELFSKNTEYDHLTKSDECLLSVSDKVSKFTNKIDTITKPKDATKQFKDTERRVHSDYDHDNLKSDECLLSVSEKVNKFVKGSREAKDSISPARKFVDEYDTETVYQDDYTKLSVNDKAHFFVESAENSKITKTKPITKVERPNLSEVDESLKSDECMLSVSDKVNKFVKTAEQFLTETQITEEKEKSVREEYERLMKRIVQDSEEENDNEKDKVRKNTSENTPSFAKETTASHSKIKDYISPNLKTNERTPTVKITTLRSSEAVKKAKALFENIATTNQTATDIKTTKLTDIGVVKKSPITDSTIVLHPSLEDCSPDIGDSESEVDTSRTPTPKNRPTTVHQPVGRYENKSRASPSRHTTHMPDVKTTKSPTPPTTETTKTVLSRYPAAQVESPKQLRPEFVNTYKSDERSPKQPNSTETKPSLEVDKETSREKTPSYQRPTITSHTKDQNTVEEIEVSTRRGSGKFGVELRRTSVERSTVSSERRRSSTDHHQPCIEDIFDLDLLEQMLEKVVGYEQRRRIRAQIRVAKKKMETESMQTLHTTTRNVKKTNIIHTRSPERKTQVRSPERQPKSRHETLSPERPRTIYTKAKTTEQTKVLVNGHSKEPSNISEKQRPLSPENHKSTSNTVRQSSPEKKARSTSPSKTATKPKSNRFSEYQSAYMKKVGLNEHDKIKFSEVKTKKTDVDDRKVISKTRKSVDTEDQKVIKNFEEKTEFKTSSVTKSVTERRSSKDTTEIVKVNGRKSVSPEKKRSPERTAPNVRLYQRSPSPDFKRPRQDNKETIIKTVYETEQPQTKRKETVIRTVTEERPITNKKGTTVKSIFEIEKKQPKQIQEEKPSWVTNRNLKKVTSETRAFSSKKLETEKQKYRAPSPSKVISKPIDVITSSYGPGPLDADGKPLFGIKALRNGASNYQVKGTVVRQEFHSRNGGEPEGTVSVTAYSTEPEELERLLQVQGDRPSRLHGLAAITTTKKFGGDTGTTLKEAHSKKDRASLEQFTHHERRMESRLPALSPGRPSDKERRGDRKREEITREERREDKKTVRQSSVKSLTEKYIKSASDSSRTERTSYPKAGLILRTVSMKDSASSDSSHAGLGRTDSEHSLGSVEETTTTTVTTRSGPVHSKTQTSETTVHKTVGPTQTTKTRVTSPGHTRSQGQRAHVSGDRVQTVTGERSFLDSSTKVTGVQDILTRMKNADIVIEAGDTVEDSEARALLNKFLGATVLMAGMQNYVTEKHTGKVAVQESVRSGSGGTGSGRVEREFDPEQCWDERLLRKRLEESTDYEQRRRLRARIRTLMAEQEACTSAVTEALGAAAEAECAEGADAREEKEVTVTSSVRRNSSEKTVSGSTTTKTTKVIESMTRTAPKPVSAFAKFRQLEKQNSTNSPNSPQTPKTPSSPSPYFKFTDPALHASAVTIKERLLQWCRDKTRDYENVKLENFSTSWADGLAFCALVHHFLPDAFDYSKLTADKRRHNFTLAFKVADEKAGIYPLLDVDDMVAMRKPDWKCVFTYVQSIHRRFKDQQ